MALIEEIILLVTLCAVIFDHFSASILRDAGPDPGRAMFLPLDALRERDFAHVMSLAGLIGDWPLSPCR